MIFSIAMLVYRTVATCNVLGDLTISIVEVLSFCSFLFSNGIDLLIFVWPFSAVLGGFVLNTSPQNIEDHTWK